MPFAYPWFFLLFILLMGGGWWIFRRNFFSHKSIPELLFSKMRNWIRDDQKIRKKYWFLLAALFFFLLVGFRPQWGQKEHVIAYEGLDIVFLMDVSRSMYAEDFSTQNRTIDRLTVAKELIKNFIQKRYQDRFGLIVFSGESFVSVPLTFDQTIFLNLLETAGPEDVRIGGTNLSDAIGSALERLTVHSEDQRGKAIILITDGDQTVDRGLQAISRIAQQKNIPIFPVGIGSTSGVKIPQGRDVFGHVVYLQYQGQDVITRINEATLKQIAQLSGGRYFHAESFEDLRYITQDLDALPKNILEKLNITTKEERYQWFFLVGFVCFVIFLFFPTGRHISFESD